MPAFTAAGDDLSAPTEPVEADKFVRSLSTRGCNEHDTRTDRMLGNGEIGDDGQGAARTAVGSPVMHGCGVAFDRDQANCYDARQPPRQTPRTLFEPEVELDFGGSYCMPEFQGQQKDAGTRPRPVLTLGDGPSHAMPNVGQPCGSNRNRPPARTCEENVAIGMAMCGGEDRVPRADASRSAVSQI